MQTNKLAALALLATASTVFSGCAADTEEPTSSSVNALDETMSFDLRGRTSLKCDAGELCTLSASIYSVDGAGRKDSRFANYLAGSGRSLDPEYAAECTLTFDGDKIGNGYYKSPMGCGLTRQDGAYEGTLEVRYSLHRDDVATLIKQNANLFVKQGNLRKFIISFTVEPSFQGVDGTSYAEDGTQSTLAGTHYNFDFRRNDGQLGLIVSHNTSGEPRWLSHVQVQGDGTLYGADSDEGIALLDATGLAARVSPRALVEHALHPLMWQLEVHPKKGTSRALFWVQPKFAAVPVGVVSKEHREGYSTTDTTGLSKCFATGGDGWSCKLTVKQ